MSEDHSASDSKSFNSRGIYYFSGRIQCPLAGVGHRGDYHSNRLVLDNTDSSVTIDRTRRHIEIRNSTHYAEKSPICDLLFLADGLTPGGKRVPFSVHLKVFKTGHKISIDLHRHLRTEQSFASAEYEPFEVTVTDGESVETVLDSSRIERLIGRPSLALRIVKAIMKMRDHLEGMQPDPTASDVLVADISVGFGAFGLEWMLARAQLRATGVAPGRHKSIGDMLQHGSWEMRLTALSERWLPEVVKRDLFLFGLDEVALLQDVRAHGLRKGQTMSFRFKEGFGEIALDDKSEPLPSAIDVARDYLEFHLLGGLLAERAERLAHASPS